MITKLQKAQKQIACGLLPILLGVNLTLLGNAVSTPQLAGWENHLFSRFIVKLDDEQFRKIEVVATAYSSTADQTDDTPFITAANTRTRDGVVAANFLKLHTKIKIPELYGDKIFSVEDRMHRRYTKANPPRIDIWMPSRWKAKRFGVKKTYIVIVQ